MVDMKMETVRLRIRRFVPEDLDAFRELIRDKMASPYAVYDHAFPTDEAGLGQVLKFFAGSDEFWALQRKAGGELIGFISLNHVDGSSRNLGYCLHTQWQGQGFAAEAADGIIRYAREELKLKKLVTGTAEENLPSVRLLKRLGFDQVGPGSYELALEEKRLG